jgi:hypothetical protein
MKGCGNWTLEKASNMKRRGGDLENGGTNPEFPPSLGTDAIMTISGNLRELAVFHRLGALL